MASWAFQNLLGSQWVASVNPLPKAPPVQPLRSNEPPIVVPPPPSRSPPEFVRSEKRRKLQDQTQHICENPWDITGDFVSLQDELLHEYENTIEQLNYKIKSRDSCIYEYKSSNNNLHRQLFQRNALIRKKVAELANVKNNNLALQTQIDSISLRIATEASENEEKIQHYKSLVQGLQKTAANGEESVQYLRHMKKILFDYENGETLENSLVNSDRKCSICMENHANIVCMPCMHLEFCHSCALQKHDLKCDDFSLNKKTKVNCKCPRCNSQTEELLYIFT